MATRILLVGGGAREHAIGEALKRASLPVELYVFAQNENPGLRYLASDYVRGEERDTSAIVKWAEGYRVDVAVIGLEDALAVGLPDRLEEKGIPTVGPSKAAAQVETSKRFLRELMARHDIAGGVEHHYFGDASSLERFLHHSSTEYALKPIGLTAGKGVQVMGVQLHSVNDAIEYGRRVIHSAIGGDHGILLEERLRGVEFTLQAFVDGRVVAPAPLVKDYKLAYDGDEGPNTGSMGSYSEADGRLPFVGEADLGAALDILRHVVTALEEEGTPYKGVIYGQFMQTHSGPRLVEINARFGDPEGINILALLENDFLSVCEAIVTGTLASQLLRFRRQATVCTYLTPPGYPENPVQNSQLLIDEKAIAGRGVSVFYAKVNGERGRVLTTASRSIALLGLGDTVEDAHVAVESVLEFVDGDMHMRRDIGTRELIEHDASWLLPMQQSPRIRGRVGVR